MKQILIVFYINFKIPGIIITIRKMFFLQLGFGKLLKMFRLFGFDQVYRHSCYLVMMVIRGCLHNLEDITFDDADA